jgi:hypothetical protein
MQNESIGGAYLTEGNRGRTHFEPDGCLIAIARSTGVTMDENALRSVPSTSRLRSLLAIGAGASRFRRAGLTVPRKQMSMASRE